MQWANYRIQKAREDTVRRNLVEVRSLEGLGALGRLGLESLGELGKLGLEGLLLFIYPN